MDLNAHITQISKGQRGSREEGKKMRCQSCREEYVEIDAGICKKCYGEASETEEELKREIKDLKSKVSFLRLNSPLDSNRFLSSFATADVFLHAVVDSDGVSSVPAVPAHRIVLISRSPIFKAMLDSEMEESKSGIIKIFDVSYNVLCSFVHYLYTAQVLLDEQMAYNLFVLAEKYKVKHLKSCCENFMTSKVTNDNAISSYVFSKKHNAKQLLDASLSVIMGNMATFSESEEYKELIETDPRLVLEVYEACVRRHVNTVVEDFPHLKVEEGQ